MINWFIFVDFFCYSEGINWNKVIYCFFICLQLNPLNLNGYALPIMLPLTSKYLKNGNKSTVPLIYFYSKHHLKSFRYSPRLICGRIFVSSLLWNCLTGWIPLAGWHGWETSPFFRLCFPLRLVSRSNLCSLKFNYTTMFFMTCMS